MSRGDVVPLQFTSPQIPAIASVPIDKALHPIVWERFSNFQLCSQSASLAQSVARRSHNPKVVSSILTRSIVMATIRVHR